MSGPFKMKGSPMKRNFGISPVKQHERYSQRVGPAQDPKKIREALYKDPNSKEHRTMSEYVKYYPKKSLGKGEKDARAYL